MFAGDSGFGTLNRSRGLHGSRSMETHIDFVQWLDTDVSLNILMCLKDPADVVRAGSVSRLWHEFGMLFKFSFLLKSSPLALCLGCETELAFLLFHYYITSFIVLLSFKKSTDSVILFPL